MTRSGWHHMLLVLGIMGVLASSSVKGDGGDIGGNQHSVAHGHVHGDGDVDKEYRVSNLEVSTFKGVANNGDNEDRSRTGRGFWGQMANSNKNEEEAVTVPRTELTIERNKRPREKIRARTKSDSSLLLGKKKSLAKRIENAKMKTRTKTKKQGFRKTAGLRAKIPIDYDTYVYDYDYENNEYNDDKTHKKGITGEESRQYKRQALLDHILPRQPPISRRQGAVIKDEEETMEEILGLRRSEQKDGNGKLAAQVNAVAVLDMIKSLQEEIKDLNVEIENENLKMLKLKQQKKVRTRDDELNAPVRNAAQESTQETMKELALQKEDTTMKKVIVQMMLMKQIQKKKNENKKLELALQKLTERRKIINTALKQQKEIADEKRRLAQKELERQKKLMEEKEQLILRMKEEEESNQQEREERKKKQRQQAQKLILLNPSNENKQVAVKAQLLEAHKLLVDRSNERILARIEEMKMEREKEAIAEQEQLLKEQRKAIAALRSVKKQRLRKQKEKLGIKPSKTEMERIKVAAKLRLPETSPILNLSNEERKQVLEWLDLERNAAILEKTDRAIAAKLKAKNAALSSVGQILPSSKKVKSAAQVLINAGDTITDDEIDSILGLTGIDNGLSDADILGLDDPEIISLDDPTILDLDDDDLLFEDYEYGDDVDYGDYDYEEIVYDYEYEDEEVPEIEVEYEYDDYEYEYDYEDEPVVIKKPPSYAKPSYQPYPKKQHGHYVPRKPYRPHSPSYPRSASRYPTSHSGPEFLSEVEGLLGQAEQSLDYGSPPHITLAGSLRSALLRDVDDHVKSQIDHLPGGRVSTKVTIGAPGRYATQHSPTWKRSSQRRQDQSQVQGPGPRPGQGPRQVHGSELVPRTRQVPVPGHVPRLRQAHEKGHRSNNILQHESTHPSPRGTTKPKIRAGASFSEIMGDLLVGKPPIPGVRRT